jgi:hypothetical protein
MARFTVRVELYDHPTEDDYRILHTEMAAHGFRRTLTSDDGREYCLPETEYNRVADDVTIENALSDAKAAVAKTQKGAGILITEAERRFWCGLARA